jgi:hypothetical protein
MPILAPPGTDTWLLNTGTLPLRPAAAEQISHRGGSYPKYSVIDGHHDKLNQKLGEQIVYVSVSSKRMTRERKLVAYCFFSVSSTSLMGPAAKETLV